ncbi:MAG: alpha/beta fold hydrolase [Patescibacteria group bacterium]
MKKIILYCLILLTVLVGTLILFQVINNKQNQRTLSDSNYTMGEKITFTTKDGVNIVGNYYSASSTKGIVLLHMMPATKESWVSFVTKLQSAGFKVLAIDLRGHGESIEYRVDDNIAMPQHLDYTKFSDAQHQASIQDVESAVEFLKTKGVTEINLGGASIGANLSLQLGAEHTEIKKVILLSPGFDYRGIKTENYSKALKPNQAVFFVSDENDMRSYSGSAATMSQQLYNITPAKKEIRIFKGAGHGTDIFAAHPELEDELIQWLLK